MPANKYGIIISGAIAIVLLAAAGDFKDLSTLQTAATYARNNLERAETRYRADAEEVRRQQQTVDDLKKELDVQMKRLDEAKRIAGQSRQQYQVARNKYDRAQSELGDALKKK